jgi:drug/metabolite transporter (DMT)-like permease
MESTNKSYVQGAACALAAVIIWSSWHVVTRLTVTTILDAWDITAIRFGVAGIVLLPVLVRRGLAGSRLGWMSLAVLVAGLGAPYALVAAAGLRFAPAYDSGALNPGCMPLFVALIAAGTVKERASAAQLTGLSLILAGVVVIVVWHGTEWDIWRSLGDVLFLLAAFLSAASTVVMRQARLDPFHAAAVICTGSLLIYLPIYVPLYGAHLMQVSLPEIAIQAIFQGVIVTVIALLLYGRAVMVLGAAGGAAFGALVPVLAALSGIALLGEWPSETGWGGIGLISAGVYLASGAPLPGAVRVLDPRPSQVIRSEGCDRIDRA